MAAARRFVLADPWVSDLDTILHGLSPEFEATVLDSGIPARGNHRSGHRAGVSDPSGQILRECLDDWLRYSPR